MKKSHYKTLKFNSIFSLSLALVFLIVIFLFPDIILGISMAFLVIYVAGNGLIHARSNKLERDTLIEYILLSVIALVIVVGAITR